MAKVKNFVTQICVTIGKVIPLFRGRLPQKSDLRCRFLRYNDMGKGEKLALLWHGEALFSP